MKNLKNIILTFSSLFLLSQAAAQPENKKTKDSLRQVHVEEMKKLRHDLFVKKLELTPEEEAGFFPIYDEYQLKLKEARKAFRTKWKGKKPEDLTEEEASVYLDDAIAMREKEVELFKTYSTKLKEVIPARKVVILPRVEREIQHELIKEARKHREGGKPAKGKKGKPGRHGPPPPSGSEPPPDEDGGTYEP